MRPGDGVRHPAEDTAGEEDQEYHQDAGKRQSPEQEPDIHHLGVLNDKNDEQQKHHSAGNQFDSHDTPSSLFFVIASSCRPGLHPTDMAPSGQVHR